MSNSDIISISFNNNENKIVEIKIIQKSGEETTIEIFENKNKIRVLSLEQDFYLTDIKSLENFNIWEKVKVYPFGYDDSGVDPYYSNPGLYRLYKSEIGLLLWIKETKYQENGMFDFIANLSSSIKKYGIEESIPKECSI